tara:strand:+ start:10328 stop:10873 length:546 start_codon:yes stop_codon:yes gene_type:complete
MNSNKIDPSIWGPYAWHILHNVCINAKVTDSSKHDYLDFIQNFRHIIPCPRCKGNLEEKYKMIPMTHDTISSSNMTHWIYMIHNTVNIDTNKNIFDYNKHIELHRETNNKKYRTFINIILDIMGDNPSYEDFIKIHTFIYKLYKVYPSRDSSTYKKCFSKYDDISSPVELKKWFVSSKLYE